MLWFVNRSTGLVLLLLFTLVTVLGILATRQRAGGRVPAFVSRDLHRNLALLSVALLGAHITSAVMDSYVDIRWWQAVIPWAGSTYEPLWLGLGTLALDIWAALVLTSMVRMRLGPRAWRAVHVLAYVSWPAALLHSWGIGTDLRHQDPWAVAILAGSVGLVAAAATWRLGSAALGRATEVAR